MIVLRGTISGRIVTLDRWKAFDPVRQFSQRLARGWRWNRLTFRHHWDVHMLPHRQIHRLVGHEHLAIEMGADRGHVNILARGERANHEDRQRESEGAMRGHGSTGEQRPAAARGVTLPVCRSM